MYSRLLQSERLTVSRSKLQKAHRFVVPLLEVERGKRHGSGRSPLTEEVLCTNLKYCDLQLLCSVLQE